MERISRKAAQTVDLSAFLLEYHTDIRMFFASGLKQAGFTQVDTSVNMKQAKNAMTSNNYDFMLLDGSRDLKTMASMIRSARENLTDAHPFGIYMISGDAPDSDETRAIMKSGCDAFLVRPFSQNTIKDRIDWVTKEHRVFVVSNSYVGPERRKQSRDTELTRRVAVPNSLKAKQSADFNPEDHRAALNDALFAFNAYLIERETLIMEQGTAEQQSTPALSQRKILKNVKSMVETLAVGGRQHLRPALKTIAEIAGERLRRGSLLDEGAARDLRSLSASLAAHTTRHQRSPVPSSLDAR